MPHSRRGPQRFLRWGGSSGNTFYFAGNVIAEKDQSGAWTDYIFAGGKRIAKAPGVASTSGTQYYHADHLGTARLMTDANGNVVAGSESTTLPYGEEYTPTPSATGNHYIFTGKERDAESGLDYFGARYYRSTSGRWLTPDWSDAPTPVPYADFSDPQSLNQYGYVRNRPIINIDDDGHDVWYANDKIKARVQELSSKSETFAKTMADLDANPNIFVGFVDKGLHENEEKSDGDAVISFNDGAQDRVVIQVDPIRTYDRTVAHEVGHANDVSSNREQAKRDVMKDNAQKGSANRKPHPDRPHEDRANKFRDKVLKEKEAAEKKKKEDEARKKKEQSNKGGQNNGT